MYTGKEAGIVQKNLGRKAIMSLMESFLDKGITFPWTIITLLLVCLGARGRTGTVRSNRVGLPSETCNLKSSQVKQLKRGESLYRRKGTLTCVTWHNRKVVSVLATVSTSEADSDEVERSVKVRGHWEKKNVARPGVINLYNTYVGGVDVSNQRVTAYSRLMRGTVWYCKVFSYLIEVCISNAHILERKSLVHTTRNSLKYRRSLISELIQHISVRKDARTPQTSISQIRLWIFLIKNNFTVDLPKIMHNYPNYANHDLTD